MQEKLEKYIINHAKSIEPSKRNQRKFIESLCTVHQNQDRVQGIHVRLHSRFEFPVANSSLKSHLHI